MYIELKCCSCKENFRVDFTSAEYDTRKCPKCGSYFNSDDVERIRKITETCYMNVNKINSVKICEIHEEENREDRYLYILGDVYFENMKRLAEMYYSAPTEVRCKLESLIDKFYLLVYRDVAGEKIDELDFTLEKMNDVFLEKIKKDHAEMGKILGLDQEE